MARLFDCFTFFNELELLEIRLVELYPVVDVFVLVEARRTHRDQPKPLYFAEAQQRFARWSSKLRHVVIDDFDISAANEISPRRRPSDGNWSREWLQRHAILRGLADARADDLVAVSDVDEIPSREIIAALKADPRTQGRLSFLQQQVFMNRLDWHMPQTEWFGTRIVARRYLRSPQALRLVKPRAHRLTTPGFHGLTHRLRVMRDMRALITPRMVPDAGWHFTSLGDPAKIDAKLGSYAHGAESGRTNVECVTARMAAGRTHTNEVPQIVSVEKLPKDVGERPSYYAHLLSTPPARNHQHV